MREVRCRELDCGDSVRRGGSGMLGGTRRREVLRSGGKHASCCRESETKAATGCTV